jgi:ribosomal-protein-alanine N-acetyltransferase
MPRRPGGKSGLVLEPMTAADLDEVTAIEDLSFGSPWSKESFLFDLEENVFSRSTVARDKEGRIVGYSCCWHLHEELKINNIAVHPKHRGKGIGRTLLRAALEAARGADCQVALLEVRPSNSAARALYASEGFVEVGRRKDYYTQEREDALVLALDLVKGES